MKLGGNGNSDGKKLVAQITISVWSDESMGVEGPTHDLPWMLAALDHAKQSVKDHHSARPIIIPGHDSSLVVPAVATENLAPIPNYRKSA